MRRISSAAALALALSSLAPTAWAQPPAGAADTALIEGTPLPAPPAGLSEAYQVRLSGGRVTASWVDPADPAGGSVLTAAADGLGAWAAVADPPLAARDFEAAGEVVQTASTGGTSGSVTSHLVWPGGSREVSSLNVPALLGRGGALLLRAVKVPGGPASARPEDVRTGVRSGWSESLPQAADGRVVTFMGPAGALVSYDLAAGTAPSATTVDVPCVATALQTAGRWALMTCPGSSQEPAGQYLADLDRIVPSWPVPHAVEDGPAMLGDGFVAWAHSDGSGTAHLVVVDLGDFDHGQRLYGPVRSDLSLRSFATDDADGHRLAYIDPSGRPRVADVGWLTPPATLRPDVTAPHVTSVGVDHLYSQTGSMTYSWTFADAPVDRSVTSGLDSYDVRYRQYPHDRCCGSWQQPPQWTGMTATSVTLSAPDGMTTCFQARARDKAGNVSAWNGVASWDETEQCVTVDRTTPRLISISAPRVASTLGGPIGPAFEFAGSTYLSYDGQYRYAPVASSPGAWTAPPLWNDNLNLPLQMQMTAAAGSDTCFRVRARDQAGHLSGWSPMRCTAVPMDDTSLTAVGDVRRVATPAVPYGHVSTLAAAGAALTYPAVRVNRVAIGAQLGPGQGAVDVYVGNTKLGRASFVAAKNSWGTVWLPPNTLTGGQLRLVRVGSANATIDWVAFAQQ